MGGTKLDILNLIGLSANAGVEKAKIMKNSEITADAQNTCFFISSSSLLFGVNILNKPLACAIIPHPTSFVLGSEKCTLL
jgi:hypothetical protein